MLHTAAERETATEGDSNFGYLYQKAAPSIAPFIGHDGRVLAGGGVCSKIGRQGQATHA